MLKLMDQPATFGGLCLAERSSRFWTDAIVPDTRSHRGPHPEDGVLFAAEAWPRLRSATDDLSWLLGRSYSMVSALKLVGDRYQLQERQRMAVMRSACSDQAICERLSRCAPADQWTGRQLLLDGYNVLTSVEAALGGGVILQARDGCYRDLASMHGTYRKVAETIPALRLIGQFLASRGIVDCLWYLDSPVSNSGRLKTIMTQIAQAAGWKWQVELVQNPDSLLAESRQLVATADSAIIDRCQRWANLAREVITDSVPTARVIDLSGRDESIAG